MSTDDTPFTDDPLFRESHAYPELFPVTFSHREFPMTARVMRQTATPFGCLVTPFMPLSDRSHVSAAVRKNADNASKVARCDVCTGYLNPYCDVTQQRWFCSLCGARNAISRSQSRYRSTDPRLLPEVQHMLVDYQTAESVSPTKPFVHVLLVQESMPLDSLNAVVDSLSAAIGAVHPDVFLVLITFSNRVGVYRLSGSDAATQQPNPPNLTRQVSMESSAEQSGSKLYTPTPPPVQHIHFTYAKSSDALASVFDLAGVRQSLLEAAGSGDGSIVAGCNVAACRFDTSMLDDMLGLKIAQPGSSYGELADRVAVGKSILEGRDPAVDFQRPDDSDQGAVEPLLNIGDAINFWDACSRVGCCRSSFKNAVASLFDACPSVSSQQLFPGGSTEDSPTAEGPGMGALNMFGPAMDAVLEWLTTDPAVRGGDSVSAAVDCYDDGTSMTPQLAPRSVVDTLLGALSSFGLTSKRAPAVGDAGHAAENRAPSALVCGMVLHVLLASSPDLPLGLHNSVSAGSAADRNRSLFNPEWVEATADKASKNNICINLWGVAPFSSHVVGLSELSSLASKTGGKTYRFLLGTTPVAERYRLSLQLARALSAQYASRCVLKLRASQLVDLVDSSMMGHLTADPLLPGVYRVPCCSQDATMASFLDYRGGAEGTEHAEIQHLVVQVAFSYETLVEAEDDAFPFEVDSEDQSQCIDKDDGAGFYTGGSYCDPLSADTTAAISVAQPLGYASMPSNLLHPEEGSTIELASFDVKNQRSDFPIQSQDQVHSLPGNNRLGLPTFTFGEAESTPLPDEDYLNPDEAYRRFSEAVCRVSSDATFAKEYRAEMQSLKLKNKSSRRNGSNSSSDLSNVFAEVNLGFSHKKKLISVRRLRIITIAVDCVDKVPRLLSGTQPDVVAVLVTREVLYNVNVDSSDTINGGVVKLIGGLYEWCKNLTMCAAKGYLVSKLGRQFADRKKDGSKSEQFASLVKEAVEAASKDPITQTSLYIIFGAMSRIIGGHTDNNNALTIGVCISRYLGDSIDRISGGQSTLDSAIPARQKAHKSFSAESSQRSVGPPTFCFSDSFSEVLSVVLTQDANTTQRYLHPQLLPIRDDGHIIRYKQPSKTADVSSLVVENRLIPPNRSGLAWSMMSDGSPMFLLDAGDEVILYRNLSQSGKKPFAGASSQETPLPEHLVSNNKWLVNDINRRIGISNYVPRFHYSRSGTASSGYMSNHLIDLSGDENSIAYMIDDIKQKLIMELMQEL